jgi:spectrin beta
MLDVALKEANDSWSELRVLVDEKKEEFIHAEMIQKFLLDGSETEAWIEEKAEIIEQTRDYGDSLSGVMALQRKLATMERDVNAIKSKISDLEAEAEGIKSKYPEDENQLNEVLDSVRSHFQKLENLLKLREEKLGQAGNLQTFMRDLAEFQQWLEKTQTAIASEDHPSSLADAERLLAQHESLQEEVAHALPRYQNLKQQGQDQMSNSDESSNPTQNRFLEEQLTHMDQNWDELDQMMKNRELLLRNELAELRFNNDCQLVEQALAEVKLQSVQYPSDPSEAETALEAHKSLVAEVNDMKPRVESILESAEKDFPDNENVQNRAKNLDSKYQKIIEMAEDTQAKLEQNAEVTNFLRDCTEGVDWIKEKKMDLGGHDHHDQWQKASALSQELAANQSRLDKIRNDGNELKKKYPECAAQIDEYLDGLTVEWSKLENDSAEKEKELFNQHKNEILEKSAADLEL